MHMCVGGCHFCDCSAVWERVHMDADVCGGQRRTLGVISQGHYPLATWTGFLQWPGAHCVGLGPLISNLQISYPSLLCQALSTSTMPGFCVEVLGLKPRSSCLWSQHPPDGAMSWAPHCSFHSICLAVQDHLFGFEFKSLSLGSKTE